MVAAWDDFHIEAGVESATFSVVGRVICGEFLIDHRDQWTATNWDFYHDLFQFVNAQSGAMRYFPNFMGAIGRSPIPFLTIKPSSASVTDHWLTAGAPLYVAHPSDSGLRWNIVRWTTSP